ncbi:MAG: flagellar biosynthetic protein FliO [Planctomycetota bacterium]
MQNLLLLPVALADVQAKGPDLTQYFMVLGGVALVLVAVAFGLRRLIGKSQFGLRASKRNMRIVEVLPLGARRQVAVVRCFDRTFALGLGEKDVSLIAELDAEMVRQIHEPDAAPVVGEVEVTPAAAAALAAARDARNNLRSARRMEPVAAMPAEADPFEALFEQAQARLQRARAQEAQARAAQTAQAGGLEELC